jgi:hypothetical protein
MKLSYLCLISLLAVQSCALSGAGRGPSNAAVKVMPAAEERLPLLLQFYETYSNLGQEAQKKAFNESLQALSINKNDLVHRIKMATMLAIPTSQLRDIPKAENLLQELMQDQNMAKLDLAFIGLLYEFTQESHKLQQRFRDESKKLDMTQQRYELLQQKNDNLEQKLQDLKNIEKSLSERDIKSPDKKKP